MNRVIMCLVPVVLVAAPMSLFSHAGEGPSGDGRIDFSREVLPILSDKCFVCHGPDARDADMLRLDSFERASEDRGGYRAIDPDSPEASELLKRIHSADDPMPPADADKQLTDAERQILSRWIRQGGEYRQHWAYVVPARPVPPKIPGAAGRSAIDAFVEHELVRRGAGFAPVADREVLARRAALVLTGLPPELDLLQSFLDDDHPDAYARFVDRLLASPRFGEHQARYWLDAVRYGDTHGLHLDNRRGIYPYRDWVVRAFNQNLPLDQFIEWQIAGDLLESPTLEQLVATGYVRLNPSTGEGGAIAAEFQAKNNFDRVETFGTVFLGASLVCARCHNHKYDPYTQTDYYRLLAFFNSTAEPPLDGNRYEYGPTVNVPADQAGWSAWEQISRQQQQMLSYAREHFRRRSGWSTEVRKQWEAGDDWQQVEMLADADGPLKELGHVEPAQRLLKLSKELRQTFTTSLIAKELPTPRETRILQRGEYSLPVGQPVQPDVPAVLGRLPDRLPGNRLALAKWLTSREHPLVARVLVNRFWQSVFGAGLVRTPEEFGLQGQRPTHPELLDWLAVELQECGWDLKHFMRLLVTSRPFMQDSAWRSDMDDPENRFLGRGPAYRLDAEVIRDTGLWASGLLDRHMGGEGVKPYQPEGMWLALAHPASNTKKYEPDSGPLLYRRSLYVYWKRTSPHPMMTLFDAPDRESSCVRRSRTSTAAQSLGLFNETQRLEIGRKLAERLLHQAETTDGRLELLFRMLASRRPADRERQVCTSLLKEMRQRYSKAEADAARLLAAGEAPRDESLETVEVAAWTQVCMTVLAADVTLLLY